MPDSAKSSLLAALRQQAEAVRAHDATAGQPVEQSLQDVDRRLWTAFRWLDEALRHLEVIRPRVERTFQLGSILTVDNPQFERGFVTYRRRTLAGLELLDHVEMFYRLTGPEPIVLRVNPGGAAAIDERLRAAPMQFQYQTEQDERRVVRYGLFHIQPVITASVRFDPDYHRQVIVVTVRNVDRFESVTLEFEPAKLDEPALEELVRFMLGEPNTFLRRAPLAHLGRKPVGPMPAFAGATFAERTGRVV